MLTLGLMEGIFAFVAITLTVLIALEYNPPLHRILGPPVVAAIGFIAWGVVEADVPAADVPGLVAIGIFAFVLPLAGLRWCWRRGRVEPAKGVVTTTVEEAKPAQAPGRVVVRPLARARTRVGAGR